MKAKNHTENKAKERVKYLESRLTLATAIASGRKPTGEELESFRPEKMLGLDIRSAELEETLDALQAAREFLVKQLSDLMTTRRGKVEKKWGTSLNLVINALIDLDDAEISRLLHVSYVRKAYALYWRRRAKLLEKKLRQVLDEQHKHPEKAEQQKARALTGDITVKLSEIKRKRQARLQRLGSLKLTHANFLRINVQGTN